MCQKLQKIRLLADTHGHQSVVDAWYFVVYYIGLNAPHLALPSFSKHVLQDTVAVKCL